MSNTEFVMVSRDLMQDLYEAAQLEADQRRITLGDFRPEVQASLDKIASDAKAILDKPAQQHQGEPVAWVYMRCGEVNYDEDIVISNTEGDTLGNGDSWVPVYTHADPAEVERLAILLRQAQVKHSQERDTLRAQLAELKEAFNESQEEVVKRGKILAERDALLRKVNSLIDRQVYIDDSEWDDIARKINALFASADPSAPVEIDERAEFEKVISQKWPGIRMLRIYRPGAPANGEYELPGLEGAWQGWQARAALERKP